MPNITLNTHVITKHDTATNWANSTYVPKDGELVIATRSDDDVDIKVGDGINITSNLSGTYKYQPLRYTTLNYGGFDRIMGSAYNEFITSPGPFTAAKRLASDVLLSISEQRTEFIPEIPELFLYLFNGCRMNTFCIFPSIQPAIKNTYILRHNFICLSMNNNIGI